MTRNVAMPWMCERAPMATRRASWNSPNIAHVLELTKRSIVATRRARCEAALIPRSVGKCFPKQTHKPAAEPAWHLGHLRFCGSWLRGRAPAVYGSWLQGRAASVCGPRSEPRTVDRRLCDCARPRLSKNVGADDCALCECARPRRTCGWERQVAMPWMCKHCTSLNYETVAHGYKTGVLRAG